MANLKVSALSTTYVKVPISVVVDGTGYDPTADTVVMAFTTSPAIPPGVSDWKAATWETSGSTHYARCLVGPGGVVQLVANTYTVWIKVSDSPEVPVVTSTNHLVVF